MSAKTPLRDLIESCELRHHAFVEHELALARRLEDAMAGRPPASEWVIGPSRVGKSMLINTLARRYPETRIAGVRNLPLVVVPVPSPVTPKEMPRSVLSAMGVPSARGNSGDLFDRMKRVIEIAETKAMLFEEASHIVEIGTRLPPRAAGDWFKSLMDRLGITIILFGVPRLEKLYNSNEQLRRRSQARRQFRPYDYMDAEERKHFAMCVRTYVDMFSTVGYRFAVDFEVLVRHCYLLTGGLIGVLSAFMNRLAFDFELQGPAVISFEACAFSLSKIEAAGHPGCPAFVRHEVTPVELNQAYAFIMRDAGLPMRRPE
jgi:hypothetical protein